jgi:hypothetical protein
MQEAPTPALNAYVNEMIQNPFDAQVTLQFALNSYKT